MSKVVIELQMITGIVTDDLEYLVSLLLAGSSKEKELTEKESKYEDNKANEALRSVECCANFESWFLECSKYG